MQESQNHCTNKCTFLLLVPFCSTFTRHFLQFFVKLIFKDGKERLDLYPDMSRKQKKDV